MNRNNKILLLGLRKKLKEVEKWKSLLYHKMININIIYDYFDLEERAVFFRSIKKAIEFRKKEIKQIKNIIKNLKVK